MPTIAMKEEDKAYAVSFAVPSDAEGITMIYGRQSCDTRKLENTGCMDCGNCKFGGQEALVVFDRVFIPWDRVFLCEEYEFAGVLVERFAFLLYLSSLPYFGGYGRNGLPSPQSGRTQQSSDLYIQDFAPERKS